MNQEKITITCEWCRREWTISRELLDNAEGGSTVFHEYTCNFKEIVSKNLLINGEVKLRVIPKRDICNRCCLVLAQKAIEDMIEHGVEEIPDGEILFDEDDNNIEPGEEWKYV